MIDDRPRRGRHAEALRNDALVLDAARAVFAERGGDAPVAAVAERAGVGIGTLYRRYGGKDELLKRLCVLSLEQNVAGAESAIASDEPWEGFCEYVRTSIRLAVGAFSPLAGKIEPTEEMSRLAGTVRRRVTELVRRAHADGSLRTDANAIDILQLIERFSRAFPPNGDSQDEATRRRQVEIALGGLHANVGPPLPGPAPKPSDYVRRWTRTV
ncbi:MAG: TetR/AcrR family transcriptional regulator [Solirubrobacteraceae bacterium]